VRLQYIQHVAFETPGEIANWARSAGHGVTGTRVFTGEPIPPPEAYDWLVVLGGPMSARDETRYPWLTSEKRAIAAAIDRGKTVVGVCLGAQLMAGVLGGAVRPGGHEEIGWFTVAVTDDGAAHPLTRRLPDRFTALHWHGDTFDLPAGAVHLARSEAFENQMFVHGDRVVGIQFHLEMTSQGIADLARHCGGDVNPGPFVQSPRGIRATKSRLHDTRAILHSLLDRLPLGPHPGGIP
jgi:GMP synthase-like glutamine amidotransferase